MRTSTLVPGLLISLKTTVSGNVEYYRRDIDLEYIARDGSKQAKWETEMRIEDPAEHEEATKIRGKCRTLISGVCSKSAFGLLCPEDRSEDLSSAVNLAQDLADEFNRGAKLTRVSVYVIAGRIAADDVGAMRAINSEVRDLLDTIEGGLRRLDVETVREAASRAKSIGRMLSPDAQTRLQGAVKAARSAARRIVKAAEQGAAEVDEATLRRVRESRTAFLDIDEAGEVAAPVAEGRAIDLETAEKCPVCGEGIIKAQTGDWSYCPSDTCDWVGLASPAAPPATAAAIDIDSQDTPITPRAAVAPAIEMEN